MKRDLALGLAMAIIVLCGCGKPGAPVAPNLDGPITVLPAPVRYGLELAADPETGTLSGACALTVRNASPVPLAVIPLNLYRLMAVTRVTDEAGRALAFSQNVLVFEDWKELQVNHVRVGLERSLAPGQEITLGISYGGPLLGYAEAMRYVQDRVGKDLILIRSDSFAFPQIGVPSWAANRAAGLKDFDYVVSISVPSPLVVANAGDLVSKSEKDGRTTFVYKSRVPSWRIDLAAAAYTIIEGEGGRFRIFTFAEDAEGGRALLSSLTATLDLYARWFGPLGEFPGLTVIEIPAGYGSQADRAAVIQEATAFKDQAGRYTFYHELSHLWNVKANDPLPPRFESEGLAMFLQHLVQEKLEGKAGALDAAAAAMLGRLAKSFGEHPDWAKTAMIDYGEKDLTDLSYRVGEIFFYLLYRTLGEQAFLGTIAGFYRDHRQTGATAREFIEYFRKRAGVDMDKIFTEWVFTPEAAEIVAAGTSLQDLLRRYK
jgi:hypothetical protein